MYEKISLPDKEIAPRSIPPSSIVFLGVMRINLWQPSCHKFTRLKMENKYAGYNRTKSRKRWNSDGIIEPMLQQPLSRFLNLWIIIFATLLSKPCSCFFRYFFFLPAKSIVTDVPMYPNCYNYSREWTETVFILRKFQKYNPSQNMGLSINLNHHQFLNMPICLWPPKTSTWRKRNSNDKLLVPSFLVISFIIRIAKVPRVFPLVSKILSSSEGSLDIF